MDIDIDITPKFDPKTIFPEAIRASMIENGKIKPHLVGYYFQEMPIDNVSGLAAIPYKDAEDQDFLKIDMLHLSILSNFESKAEIRALLKIEPDWKMLENRKIVEQLFHIHKQYDIVYRLKPKSVQDLADILALIRPNKIKLLDKYIQHKASVRKELFTKRENSDLRKSHAVAYALVIKLHLNLLALGQDDEFTN